MDSLLSSTLEIIESFILRLSVFLGVLIAIVGFLFILLAIKNAWGIITDNWDRIAGFFSELFSGKNPSDDKIVNFDQFVSYYEINPERYELNNTYVAVNLANGKQIPLEFSRKDTRKYIKWSETERTNQTEKVYLETVQCDISKKKKELEKKHTENANEIEAFLYPKKEDTRNKIQPSLQCNASENGETKNKAHSSFRTIKCLTISFNQFASYYELHPERYELYCSDVKVFLENNGFILLEFSPEDTRKYIHWREGLKARQEKKAYFETVQCDVFEKKKELEKKHTENANEIETFLYCENKEAKSKVQPSLCRKKC